MRFHRVLILVLVILAGVLTCVTNASSEICAQKNGLFWIDVPQGWGWNEDQDGVNIVNPSGTRYIRISIVTIDGTYSGQESNQLVRDAMKYKIEQVARRPGKPVLNLERKIDGVFALQTGFIISLPDGMMQSTAIIFFKDKHLFEIYFEVPREFQRIEMEAIVDTMTFEEPKKEEESQETTDSEDGKDRQSIQDEA